MQKFSNSPLVSYVKLSPNHSGQRNKNIDIITPHCVVGQCSVETLGNIFAPTSRQASSNYGIGVDCRVAMYVEEKNRSWCSSSSANDNRAITIECASDSKAPYAFHEDVYEKLIELCVDICQRNGKKKLIWFGDKEKTLAYKPASDEMLLTVHRWYANKSCPGDWMYARMGDLASKVTAKLGDTSEIKQSVTTFPSCPFTVQVIIDDLNIRSSAEMGKNLTGKVTGKGIFTITEVKNGWGKLKSGAGWIYLENPSYLTILGTTAPQDTIRATKTINAPATTSADPEKIWKFLSEWLENDYAVAGIMGNLYAESALVANNLQKTYENKLGMTDAEYTSRVDNETYDNFVKDSAGYGLAQWTYWSRKQALLAFADEKQASIGNLDMQLEFLKKEMTGYGSLVSKLKSAKSVTEASTAVLTIYEKPADQGEAVQAKRASFGQKYYDQYHKEVKSDVMYVVQVGAFTKKENAEALMERIKAAGFDAILKEV